jgi:hypothetical protein
MNPVTIAIGVAAILYGLTTTYLHFYNPSLFKKLSHMKQFWGEKTGVVVHIVAYTIVPIVIGSYFVVGGFSGMTFFDF